MLLANKTLGSRRETSPRYSAHCDRPKASFVQWNVGPILREIDHETVA
jgi:hypothetical protein